VLPRGGNVEVEVDRAEVELGRAGQWVLKCRFRRWKSRAGSIDWRRIVCLCLDCPVPDFEAESLGGWWGRIVLSSSLSCVVQEMEHVSREIEMPLACVLLCLSPDFRCSECAVMVVTLINSCYRVFSPDPSHTDVSRKNCESRVLGPSLSGSSERLPLNR
jgi:hypothetical protein